MWRLFVRVGYVTYTDADLHLFLGFKSSPQTLVFTLNLDPGKNLLHRQWFSLVFQYYYYYYYYYYTLLKQIETPMVHFCCNITEIGQMIAPD